MMARWLCLITLVLAAFCIPACSTGGGGKNAFVGKYQATITPKRINTQAKFLWEFLPDGTFTAAPLGDPGTVLDKDKYQVSPDGQTLTFSSQLMGRKPVQININLMAGETSDDIITFKKLE
jgi:hypothetical protein